MDSENRLRRLIIGFCVIAIVLGAAQAWTSRFSMNADGIQYLDNASAYSNGDFQHALNSQWSPLYPWLISAWFAMVRPSPYLEFPAVHWLNFLIYLLSLAGFLFFLNVCSGKNSSGSVHAGRPREPGTDRLFFISLLLPGFHHISRMSRPISRSACAHSWQPVVASNRGRYGVSIRIYCPGIRSGRRISGQDSVPDLRFALRGNRRRARPQAARVHSAGSA